MSAENIAWYVIRVAPQSELMAEAALRDIGYEAFTPVEWKWKRVGDSTKVACRHCDSEDVVSIRTLSERRSLWRCGSCKKGFEVIRGNRRRKWAFPVFNGYSFMGTSAYWRSVHHHLVAELEYYQGMLGVRDRHGEMVAYQLRPSEIRELRDSSSEVASRYVGSFEVGASVRVASGPLQGTVAKVQEITPKNEAKLKLADKLLGMDVITVAVEHLEAV